MYKDIGARIAELIQERESISRLPNGCGRDRRKLSINKCILTLRKRQARGPQDPNERRAHYQEAARKRVEARRPAWKLAADLRLLDSVILGIRRKLETQARAPEVREHARAKSRRTSLAAYYKKRDAYNAARRWKPTPENNRKDLFRACTKVAGMFSDRQASLGRAVRRIVNRQTASLRRHLRRRYEKATAYLKVPGSKSAASQRIVGCSLFELRLWLEARFQPGMTWANHGLYGWHIDHVIPISKFDLADPAQVRACFHYTNLQPLWAPENLSKRNKI
jgi:hypothetical protein